MGTAKLTNGLLAMIAICLLWLAFKPHDGTRIGAGSIVRSATAQTDDNLQQDEEETALEAICTLSAVDEAAARTLVGSLQTEVITALSQTNTALLNLQRPLSEIVRGLQRVEGQLQNIDKNTKSY